MLDRPAPVAASKKSRNSLTARRVDHIRLRYKPETRFGRPAIRAVIEPIYRSGFRVTIFYIVGTFPPSSAARSRTDAQKVRCKRFPVALTARQHKHPVAILKRPANQFPLLNRFTPLYSLKLSALRSDISITPGTILNSRN